MAIKRRLRQRARDLHKMVDLYLKDRPAFHLVRRVQEQGLTYLEPSALIELYEEVNRLEVVGQKGVLVEAGVALGGSALVLAAAKSPARPLYLYDAFEMIPAPSSADGSDAHARYEAIASGRAEGIKGSAYYGYQENLLDKVKDSFHAFGLPPKQNQVEFVRGYYQDTLYLEQPIALAHLDCDWYESVMTCLQRIEPEIVPGGVLVVDDYQHWSGCRKAVDDYFAGREGEFRFEMKSRLHITRR